MRDSSHPRAYREYHKALMQEALEDIARERGLVIHAIDFDSLTALVETLSGKLMKLKWDDDWWEGNFLKITDRKNKPVSEEDWK